jgi:hypothetical protein
MEVNSTPSSSAKAKSWEDVAQDSSRDILNAHDDLGQSKTNLVAFCYHHYIRDRKDGVPLTGPWLTVVIRVLFYIYVPCNLKKNRI